VQSVNRLIPSGCARLRKVSTREVQGNAVGGNYAGAMREAGPTPNGSAAGGAIDWPAALASHDGWLRLVVLARVGERQAVEEVMQDVALAAVAGRARLAAPERLTAWLYRLAVRQALLYRRRCGRRRKLMDRYAAGRASPESADGRDPLGWLIRDERAQLVRDALGRMPPRDAEILLLKYSDGCTARELADRLGVSLAAIEARLHRVRRRLRDLLIDSGLAETREREP
jgi:RNA polymerase sigma-70 factor (ECF subfamily)